MASHEFDPRLACPTCLDLEYNLFKDVPDTSQPDTRYNIATFKTIRTSAQGECRLCSILYQGITFFWSDISDDDDDDDDDDEGQPGCQITNEVIKSIREDSEIESGAWTPEFLFLVLRPEKPLFIHRYPNCTDDGFSGCHTRLEFFTESNRFPTHPAFGHAAKVPSHLSPAHCTTILKTWLQECDTRHNCCFAPLSILPKRLVYVAEEIPRLVETSSLAYSKYTTLSHCWGKGTDMIKTTKTNLYSRIEGMPWEDLPQIFRDAISVTRHINCQWIWIDSLCIIQDDEVDWKEESSKMADIYSNSFLNIAITFSSNSLGSCFSHRKSIGDFSDGYKEWPVEAVEIVDDRDRTTTGISVRVSHSQGHEYITQRVVNSRKEAAPLLDRAWVLHERLLAPRTFHFGLSELIWECNASAACECTGISDKHNSANSLKAKFAAICQDRASKEEALNCWLEIVKEYSSLSLSKLSDRPYALARVASRICGKLDTVYLAGMWAADLPRALIASKAFDRNRKRPSPAGPTWSWMSQYRPEGFQPHVLYERSFVPDWHLRIHHSNTFCEYVNNNPFGSVLSGQLELTATTGHGRLEMQNGSDWNHVILRSAKGLLWADCPVLDRLENDSEVLCLYMGLAETRMCVLVLKLLNGTTHYVRVAVAHFDLAASGAPEFTEIKRVRIL